MSRRATIIIPDISGFTEFISKTDLAQSSAILCDLLNNLIAVADTRFTVAEVEGDAILFYSPDIRIDIQDVTNYCIRAFRRFHQTLNKISGKIADAAMREMLEKLTVKFICHYGEFTEISIHNFKKPMGVEIVTAHMLLKNQIPDDEYILLTDNYLGSQQLPVLSSEDNHPIQSWSSNTEILKNVGPVKYYWASLRNLSV
jgi:hypothetical protein